MPPALFLHALARFRSSLPLPQAELLSSRHAYDLSVSLRKAFWLLNGSLPDFAICWRENDVRRTPYYLCLSYDDVPFDLFGTNVLERLRESDFEEGFTLKLELFDSYSDFHRLLTASDYFTSWWPAADAILTQVELGISLAAKELSPSL